MNLIQKISVLFLSLVLFVNGTGIILNKHFCGGDLKAQAFYVPAKQCSHANNSNTKPCHKKTDKSSPVSEKDCCDNDTKYFESDLEIQDIQVEELEINKTFFVALISSFFDYPYQNFNSKKAEYLNFKPPLIIKDLEVLYQSFLC